MKYFNFLIFTILIIPLNAKEVYLLCSNETEDDIGDNFSLILMKNKWSQTDINKISLSYSNNDLIEDAIKQDGSELFQWSPFCHVNFSLNENNVVRIKKTKAKFNKPAWYACGWGGDKYASNKMMFKTPSEYVWINYTDIDMFSRTPRPSIYKRTNYTLDREDLTLTNSREEQMNCKIYNKKKEIDKKMQELTSKLKVIQDGFNAELNLKLQEAEDNPDLKI